MANTTLEILGHDAETVARDWIASLRADGRAGDLRIPDAELHAQMRELLQLLGTAAAAERAGGRHDIASPPWSPVREFLAGISSSRAAQGFGADETAAFVFSLKKPLFGHLQRALANDPKLLLDELWRSTLLLDELGMHTIKVYQETREAVIRRQQDDILELSTPVVKLWDGVLALPMIGTLDSARAQVVMESLLQRIVDTGSEIAIIDITGVPTVDTLVAQYLIRTATAIRLMGAECIVSGLRPQIAQTIVHLGISLEQITTKATLAEALALALRRLGHSVTRKP